MLRAYEAVTKYNSPISTAAKMYGIPRMTLPDKIKGKTKVDAKMGRKLILGEKNEAALLRYIKYMAEHRYPVTRTQIMGLAWAISLQDEDSDSFGVSGPSLRWWRGFRDRHKEISIRKSESVDRRRVANSVPDIINDYFHVLTSTLTDHNSTDKPSQIYNCDETAIFLNRSSEKVLIPIKANTVTLWHKEQINIYQYYVVSTPVVNPYHLSSYIVKVCHRVEHIRRRDHRMTHTVPPIPVSLTRKYTKNGLKKTPSIRLKRTTSIASARWSCCPHITKAHRHGNK